MDILQAQWLSQTSSLDWHVKCKAWPQKHVSQNRAIAASRSGDVICFLPSEELWFWTGIRHRMGGEMG